MIRVTFLLASIWKYRISTKKGTSSLQCFARSFFRKIFNCHLPFHLHGLANYHLGLLLFTCGGDRHSGNLWKTFLANFQKISTKFYTYKVVPQRISYHKSNNEWAYHIAKINITEYNLTNGNLHWSWRVVISLQNTW